MPLFTSKALAEHAEAPLADDGRYEAIVESFTERARAPSPAGRRASYIASIGASRDPTERAAQLAEITSLVRSQGDDVAGAEICHLARPNARTLLGEGAAAEIAARARAAGATMLVLDADLSPSQTRNLEDAVGLPICDREAVILNVFARSARTRRAKIQVELAQLEYLRPRIRGVGLDMDQQTGATSKARGPGETASELLARKLDDRLAELRRALRAVGTSSDTQRRARAGALRIALVGYTNAGKTSLMNALTGASLSARDAPFETLDTTSRNLTRHGGDVILSDTVGFIRRLPERLLESFASTLDEVREASLLVFVIDASDPERHLHARTTREVVERLGASQTPRLYVFNKADREGGRPDARALSACAEGHPWLSISCKDERDVRVLEETLLREARRDEGAAELFVPYEASAILARAYATCRVEESAAGETGLHLSLRGPTMAIDALRAELEEVSR